MNRPTAMLVVMAVLAAGLSTPAAAGPQIPGLPKSRELTEIMKRANQLRDLVITEEEEIKLGAGVSERVRARYGVVQDAAVHRYVTLVGTLLVKKSTRPNLPFRFIVLDTDGVNAFAAPGGYIHITRGALGLMSSEAELAGVLAHEISHVTEKHTIKRHSEGQDDPDRRRGEHHEEPRTVGQARRRHLGSGHGGVRARTKRWSRTVTASRWPTPPAMRRPAWATSSSGSRTVTRRRRASRASSRRTRR